VRHFTVDEANALIPTLTPVLEDLRNLRDRMQTVADEVVQFEKRASQNGHGENTKVFDKEYSMRGTSEEIEQRLLYLRGVGVLVKDIEHGIVDFPTRMFNRDALLCWRLGESSVSHWHDVDTGFSGRRPL
jgi:hypothetical protein